MPDSSSAFPIAIVGAGFSGICMGILLRQAGLTEFVIFEKADDLGGTWRENTYPGAACDIPSHLYSFSFEPKSDWSRCYPPQPEILEYLRHCVDKYELAPHIRYQSRLTGGTFDETRGHWTLNIEGAPDFKARALILGNGALHLPTVPQLPGMEEFEGIAFHSSRWNHEVEFSGKRVAVVGTGASAIQIVPEIAPQVEQLYVFQRTPPWILPKPDRAMRPFEKWLFRRLPFTRYLYRAFLYWQHEIRAIGFLHPRLMAGFSKLAHRYLEAEIPDEELRAAVTPSYTIGCKRVLITNEWLSTLCRSNVQLVNSPATQGTREGLVAADGTACPVDVIVFATGFSASEYLAPFDLVGRGGVRLNQVIASDPAHYLGIVKRDFPNAFLLMGPNTGLGHNSMIFMIEAQARYVLKALKLLHRTSAPWLDVKADAQSEFYQDIQERLKETVWASGCSSWYLGELGYNSTLWPGFTVSYWLQTRRLKRKHFEVGTPAPEPALV